ncbi:LysR family transcriptional regulator [Shewanella sp. KX20019]|uniref:LysR substrate-binding domain-containing protein n=1 Tax=Shewanella sp. KX20019 TaxID=2803864 RepID=UPI0019289953|nr:LysR substrate-binding domain-containing protein [Shewanella sp. KX20019]QQX80056.1 LysR family transcriptional regulator [Shewanella sp. KX20019]
MFKWEGLCEFVAVAETESFTKASQRLGISTAQVSRQISALESRLAAKLFLRTTRKVSVTEVGQIYYQHCRQLLDGLDEAERAITNLQTIPRGLLKITAPVSYGEKYIAPLINDFTVLYPELEVKLVLTNQQVDLIDEGYDLAIRLGQLADSSMMAKKLSTRTQYVCASPAYITTYGIPHSLSELEQHNCLLGTMDYWRFQVKGKTTNVRVSGTLSCSSGHALVDAAIKGIGIVQLPDFYVSNFLESKQLVTLLEHNRQPEEGIWAIYPQNRHLSPKVRMLLDYLTTALK